MYASEDKYETTQLEKEEDKCRIWNGENWVMKQLEKIMG